MYMMWLRSYPSYHNRALMFNVSVATVHNEINRCIPIIQRALEHFVQWPTIESAVGVIDSASTEIYRPQIEPQELYFSGHRHFHVIHTQVVIDNAGYICYVEARFFGHQNDAKQFTMMQQIGVIGPLHFPEDCVLLADKIYPNRHPVIYNTANKPKTRTHEGPFNIYQIIGPVHYTGHILFFLHTPAGQVYFLNSS